MRPNILIEMLTIFESKLLTYVTLWDVARLPSFLLVSGVAPDYMVVGARVSAEVVLTHVLVQFVLVRLLF